MKKPLTKITPTRLKSIGFENVEQYGQHDFHRLMPDGLFICLNYKTPYAFDVIVGQLEHFSHSLTVVSSMEHLLRVIDVLWHVDPRKTNPGQEKTIWLESNKKYQS